MLDDDHLTPARPRRGRESGTRATNTIEAVIASQRRSFAAMNAASFWKSSTSTAPTLSALARRLRARRSSTRRLKHHRRGRGCSRRGQRDHRPLAHVDRPELAGDRARHPRRRHPQRLGRLHGARVENRTETASGKRTHTAKRWTPREVSFVAVPADRNAHTRSADHERARHHQQTDQRTRDPRRRARAPSPTISLTGKPASRKRAARSSTTSSRAAMSPSGRRIAAWTIRRCSATPCRDALCFRIDPNRKPKNEAALAISWACRSRRSAGCACSATASTPRASALTRWSPARSTPRRDFPYLMQDALNKTLRVAYESRAVRAQEGRPRNQRRRLPHQTSHHAGQHRLPARAGQRGRRVQARHDGRQRGDLRRRHLRQDFRHHATGDGERRSRRVLRHRPPARHRRRAVRGASSSPTSCSPTAATARP